MPIGLVILGYKKHDSLDKETFYYFYSKLVYMFIRKKYIFFY